MQSARARGRSFFIDCKPSQTNEAVKIQVGSGGTTDTLSLLSAGTTIELTLYIDNTFTEVYWMQDGRTRCDDGRHTSIRR